MHKRQWNTMSVKLQFEFCGGNAFLWKGHVPLSLSLSDFCEIISIIRDDIEKCTWNLGVLLTDVLPSRAQRHYLPCPDSLQTSFSIYTFHSLLLFYIYIALCLSLFSSPFFFAQHHHFFSRLRAHFKEKRKKKTLETWEERETKSNVTILPPCSIERRRRRRSYTIVE